MAKNVPVDEHSDELIAVSLPSGAPFKVFPREVTYLRDRVKRYTKDNHFINISDLQDVDRMLAMELLVWRYQTWVSQQKDYWNEPIDETGYSRTVKELSAELRQLKATLGIDKVSRDKQRGEESVAVYIENLRARAKEFGVMRQEQSARAIELLMELRQRVTLHDNCTDRERLENECTVDHIMTWLRERAFPEFDEIDHHFRENKQQYWIRDQ